MKSNPPAEGKTYDWCSLTLLLVIGLYIRMMLVFFPGYVSDTNWMVKYVAFVQESGVTSVTDIWDRTLYPPVFVYQAVIASKVVSKISRQPVVGPNAPVTPWDRLGVRITSILSDILISGLLFIVVAPKSGRNSALWACSLYLFNPGTIVNSALWNYDAVPSLQILLTVILAGVAFEKRNHSWLIAASAVFAIAFCTKLQAAMFLPALAAFLLLTKSPRIILISAVVFLVVTVLAYVPFLLKGRWEYLQRVFILSFQDYPMTHVNSYNAWGLLYQMPVTNHFLGVSLENIGRLSYLAVACFSICALLTSRTSKATSVDMRQIAILSAYLCLAPFLLMTRMHERYLAPAVALALLAGFLDRRLIIVGCAVAVTYTMNMIGVLLMTTKPWEAMGIDEAYTEPIRLAFIVNRIFCSVANVLLFGWFTLRLRTLFSTSPAFADAAQPKGDSFYSAARESV
jgi:Gpi18-like mannosyltransferase